MSRTLRVRRPEVGYNRVSKLSPGETTPVTTFEAVVENGQVRLPPGVVLPERKTVYVIVPGPTDPPDRAVTGFRLANPDDARKFEMKVVWGEEA